MLHFNSASVRIANSSRAVDECMEILFEGEQVPQDCQAFIVNAAIGHKLDRIAESIRGYKSDAIVLGTSCGGVIGREGVGESNTNMAMMSISGSSQEFSYVSDDHFNYENSYEKSLELAKDLKGKLPNTHIIYLITPGMGVTCDYILKGFNEVFGDDVTIFGGCSADNYRVIATYQYLNTSLANHGVWAIGISDNTLQAATCASHGFCAYGEPMTVTKGELNTIYEIDGMPAWQAYAKRLSIIEKNSETNVKIITTGGLAKKLPEDVAEIYGNSHILRSAMPNSGDDIMYTTYSIKEGDQFWLTTRDEELIFSEQKRALEYLQEKIAGNKPAAVFHTDCLARGRTLFNRIIKDELIGMMQYALSFENDTPPWLGMYGFGEYCPLAGKNTFHTYTTSLMVLFRSP